MSSRTYVAPGIYRRGDRPGLYGKVGGREIKLADTLASA